MKSHFAIPCLIAALLATRDLPAQTAPWSAGRDVVVLRDGTTLEGQAIDVRLGDQVTFRKPDGELRIVRWADIASARGTSFDEASRSVASLPTVPGEQPAVAVPSPRASQLPPPPPDEVASLPTGSEMPPPPPDDTLDHSSSSASQRSVAGRYLFERAGTVPVVLQSDSLPLMISAIVEARGLSTSVAPFSDSMPHAAMEPAPSMLMDPHTPTMRTEYLCTTPCTLHLPPGRTTLHIGGVGRLESLQTLDVGTHGQRVLLYSSSASVFGGGVLLTLFGASIGIGGSLALLIDQTGAGTTTSGLPLSTIGLFGMAIGGLALTIGIPIVTSTHVGISRSEPHPSSSASTASHRVRLLGGGLAPVPRGDGVMAGLTFGF